MEYTVARRRTSNECSNLLDEKFWAGSQILDVSLFHPRSSDHRPTTRARVLYDEESLFVLFQVSDRYVRCTRTQINTDVCCDACVEFFVEPLPGKGYMNFEVNGIGTLHLGYHLLPAPGSAAPARRELLDPALCRKVQIATTLSGVIAEEIPGPIEWKAALRVPIDVLETRFGKLRPLAGKTWRANFYKCGSDCSHPHWATWSPIGEALNFHCPQFFSPIRFVK
ncbi:MAG: carbohydrate-binding family 9-like protein [Planctomycetes bacterium]|nr:carbohydrate-binding family 9-like protein [Planctomycetota bacterium]